MINEKEKIHPVMAGDKIEPEDDWQLISLVPPKPARERKAEEESQQVRSDTA